MAVTTYEGKRYNEVKRLARVGELVKVVRNTNGHFLRTGRVYEIARIDDGDNVATKEPGSWMDTDDYVVLESIEDAITVHNGIQYREVKRRARVGEMVKVFGHNVGVANGIFKVVRIENGCIFYKVNGDDGWGTSYQDGKAYVVLEPVGDEETAQAHDRIAQLEQQVKSLTDRVVELEGNQSEPTVPSFEYQPTVGNPSRWFSKPQYTRSQVVEMAKADVEELSRQMRHGARNHEGNYTFQHRITSPRFVENRKKRTVVALVEHEEDGVLERGIAHTAPDDCFNLSIGKAIALRRALGLTVPDYYVNAPKPTEAHVGDVIQWKGWGNQFTYLVLRNNGQMYDFKNVISGETHRDSKYRFLTHSNNIMILDDSHDFGGETR